MTIYQKNYQYSFLYPIKFNKLFAHHGTIVQSNKAPIVELK